MAPKKRLLSTAFNDRLVELLERVERMHDSLISLDKKFDLHAQKIQYELEKIHELDSQQNNILAEHQQRSVELKKDNELREQSLRHEIEVVDHRVRILEAPQKCWIMTRRKLLGVLSILTAISSLVYAVLHFFKK